MKRKSFEWTALLLSSAVMLAACGGDGGDSPIDDGGANPGESDNQALIYAYPDNNQGEIPTKAPIVLRFSSNVSATDVENTVTVTDENGDDVAFSAEAVGSDRRGVVITPVDRLSPRTQYTVDLNGLRLDGGTAQEQTVTFTTRPLEEGPKERVVHSMDSFEIVRQAPSGGELEPIMDFSTFRLQFSQPIDRTTARYGDGETVVLRDSDGDEVEASLLVDGSYMTIDPTGTSEDNEFLSYLTPGEDYTLEIGGLESTYGESFGGQTIDFTPKDSSPRGEPALLVQRLTEAEGEDGSETTSRLTGKGVNQVPVNGTLLGEDVNLTQASASAVMAELADVTRYPDVTPIRIPKGTKLTGSEIKKVMIGGGVDAGFGSGAVDMRVLSDSTGYLIPNPYSESDSALRLVKLFLDVGIATEDARTNGAFTQNLLHIELVGVAEVDTDGGVLNLDAVSMVEPDILGQEFGYGLLSFQLQSYKDQTGERVADAEAALTDATPPTLQSWTADQTSPEIPADESGDEFSWFQQPGDPIVLNFDEPLSAESLNQPGALTMTRDGNNVDITHKLDGAAVVIQPTDPEQELQYSEAGNNPEYKVQLGSQITDLAGNNFVPETLSFKLPGEVTTRDIPVDRDANYEQEDVQVNSPIVLSAYPGYPCVIEEEDLLNLDLDSGLVGRCAGGPGDWPNEEYPLVDYQADDELPLMSLPADRPIVLQFTKAIDPASVQLGGSFNIFRVDASGQPVDQDGNPVADPEPIPGSLTVEGQRITFVPEDPWADDQYYSYTLGSNNNTDDVELEGIEGFLGSEEAVCDGTESICGKDGHPLRTQPLGRAFRESITPDDVSGTFRTVADYRVGNKYFLPNGGGPNLAIFFKGEPASNDVLQTLRTSPDVDTNGNLMHDAENTVGNLPVEISLDWPLYNSDPKAASRPLPDGTLPTAEYPFQEPVPSVPDPGADPDYDPEGVQGLPNSAKIISRNTRGSDEPWYAEETNFAGNPAFAVALSQLGSFDGGNVGCGYDASYDPNTGETGYQDADDAEFVMNVAAYQFPKSEPTVCPENKFTYLKMGLNASVGGYDPEEEAIKVEIYPSQSISTSFITYMRNPLTGAATAAIPSGEQIMRMRYAKDDPACVDTEAARCPRTQPITGWIKEGDNGEPVLTAEVDLYIDAPFAGPVIGIPTLFGLRHNLRSYQATMSLTGPVSFLDDGRMVVQQRNENPIDIDMEVYTASTSASAAAHGSAMGRMPYRIPQDGVFLQMVSEPIKSME